MKNLIITCEELLSMYEMMVRIRKFEERVSFLYKKGEIPGFIHLYNGEEAVAVGVCANLGEKDIITSTHRGHGHALAKGCNTNRVMAELYGRIDGYCGGRGGSMHLYSIENGLLGTNGMVGGGISLALGAGLKFKNFKQNYVSVAFFGDGASNMGIFYESLNLAAVYKLPVIFICENNLYATSTSLHNIASNTEISQRASVFNIPGVSVDGNDIITMYDNAKRAIVNARKGNGPTLIEAKTYRLVGHHEGEPLYGTYRTKEEVEFWKEKCPIENCKRILINEYFVEKSEIDLLDEAINNEINDAVEYARNSPVPDVKDVEKYVFSEVD